MRLLAVCALWVLLLPSLATAAEFRAGDQVVVDEGEVIAGDLYVSGDTVTVDGVVLGDLVAAGREVTLNGRATGDLIAVGQTVVVHGEVGDDLRMAGTVLHLGADAIITDHIVSAGYSFEAEPGSRVGGEVFFAGSKARADGTFESSLSFAATAVEIGGSVAGDAEVELSDGSLEGSSWFEGFFAGSVPPPPVADGLTVTDSAHVGGRLSYVSPVEVAVPDAAVAGGVQWTASPTQPASEADEETPGAKLLSRVLDQVRRFATLSIFGLLLLWCAPTWTGGRVDQLSAEPLRNFAWGAAGLFGIPVAAFALLLATILLAVLAGKLSLGGLAALVVLVGFTLLVVLVAGFILAIGFTAQVLVCDAAGRAVLQRLRPAHGAGRWLPLILGLLIYAVVTGIPYLGPVIALLVTALGLGSIVQWLAARRSRGNQAANG